MKFRDWTSINLTGNIQEGYRNRLSKTAQIKHDLPPLLSRILCSSLLFVDDLFSVCFQERLCISFLQCSCLDIRLFTYALYCSLLFLSYSAYFGVRYNFLGQFSGPALRLLLVAFFSRSVSLYPALRITVKLHPDQFDFPLKMRVANYLLTQPHIY